MQQPRNLYEAVIALEGVKKAPLQPPAPQAEGLTEAERRKIIAAIQAAIQESRQERSGTR